MTSSQRIALNTLVSYGRTVFGMALGLFSSRWVLQSLGSVDYGLMSVVGGLIVFVTFLNGVMVGSCSRFFSLSIGKGDPEETNKWFNTALSIHTVLPVVLILIGWPIGEWTIGNFLNIPPDRLMTARWVFRFSLVSAFFGMCFTPYMAMYTAKQNIAELSLWGIGNTLANFCFVYWLTSYKGDAWLIYAGWTVGISILFGAGQVLRARMIFPECRVCFSRWYEWSRFVQVFSFSWWNLFGSLGYMFRTQGLVIVLNKNFPPAAFPSVNAAYQIGCSVAGYTQTLSSSFLGALSPEITATIGRDDYRMAAIHSLRASKFAVILISFFAVPLFVEVDYVLQLWLKTPPVLANVFCRLMLFAFLIDNLSIGQMMLVNSSGRIRGYQTTLGCLTMSTVLLACLLIHFGIGVMSVTIAYLFTACILTFGRVYWASRVAGLRFSEWMSNVFSPSCFALATAFFVGFVIHLLLPVSSFVRLWVTIGVTTCAIGLSAWFLVFSMQERNYFHRLLTGVYRRFLGL